MINQPDSLEFAGNMLDRHDMHDVSMPSLLEVYFIKFLLFECQFDIYFH